MRRGDVAAVLQPDEIVELVDERGDLHAGGFDVAGILEIARVVDRAEGARADEIGKADDGVERAAKAAADAGEQRGLDLGLGRGRRERGGGRLLLTHEDEIAGDDAGLALGEDHELGAGLDALRDVERARGLGEARGAFEEVLHAADARRARRGRSAACR